MLYLSATVIFGVILIIVSGIFTLVAHHVYYKNNRKKNLEQPNSFTLIKKFKHYYLSLYFFIKQESEASTSKPKLYSKLYSIASYIFIVGLAMFIVGLAFFMYIKVNFLL